MNMLDKLRSFFNKPKTSGSEKPPNAQPPIEARWLEKNVPNNPFGIAGCDCLAFTQSMLSTTPDQSTAAKWVALRGDDGQRLRGCLPQDPVEFPCDLVYQYSGEVTEGMLFKSQRMEEKWDIYLYDLQVFFCRSWTGDLVYTASITPSNNCIKVGAIFAPRAMLDEGDNGLFSTEQVDYLLKSHLFNRRVPHPLPRGFPRDPAQISLYSFKAYGNRCCFATFEDTIQWQPPQRGNT